MTTLAKAGRFQLAAAIMAAILGCCALALCLTRAADAPATLGVGATFENLQAGKTTYRHVEVRSVNARALMISHAGGLASVRLRDLSPELQAAFGYIPEDVVPMVAEALNVTRAEIHGVVTFYHDFRRTPAGRHVLKLCRAEACQAVGGEALADHARAKLGVDWHETTRDGAVTLEPVYCLGLCSVSPAAMLDGKVVARLDEEKLDALLAEAER